MEIKGYFTGNQLKLLALVFMTVDHVCKQFYITNIWLLILGRLAMPIFSYMIAEGCCYTKNKIKYFLLMFFSGMACQTVYYFSEKSLYQCILITFSLSIALIYAIDFIKKKRVLGSVLTILMLTALYLICRVEYLDFEIDYGFFGVLLPVSVFLGKTKSQKLALFTVGLVLLAVSVGEFMQWYSLLSLPLIFCYNKKRGRLKLKYFFYVYYPLHLAVIYLVSKIMN